jgi:hypothetical protein
MKKLFKILSLALLVLITYSCSEESQQDKCNCIKEYYRYRIVGYENNNTTPRYGFVLVYANNPVEDFCSIDTQGNYVFIENDMYYKINCQR